MQINAISAKAASATMAARSAVSLRNANAHGPWAPEVRGLAPPTSCVSPVITVSAMGPALSFYELETFVMARLAPALTKLVLFSLTFAANGSEMGSDP